VVVKGLAAQLQADLNFLLAVDIFGDVLRSPGRTFFAWCNCSGLRKDLYNQQVKDYSGH